MEREQFTFYASFAKAGKKIRKPAERCAFYDAVIDFALYGVSPEPGSLPDVVEMAMELVSPVLASARRKAEAGRNGGKSASEKTEANCKQGESSSEPEANRKQGENASKKEDKKEGEDKKEDKKENKCSLPPTPSPDLASLFTGDLLAAVNEWLAYKREKRQNYQPTGLKSLLTQIRKAADAHGDEAVAQVIRNSMASGYTGITLDKLTSAPQRPGKYTYTPAASYIPPKPTREDIERLQAALDSGVI